jgi:hypothetical protein
MKADDLRASKSPAIPDDPPSTPVCRFGHAPKLMDVYEFDGYQHVIFKCRECGSVDDVMTFTPAHYALLFPDYAKRRDVDGGQDK